MITWQEFKTNKKYWVWTGIILVVLCLVCGGRDNRYENKNNNEIQNVIAVTGHGEVQAVPDIANINFTIRQEGKTVSQAQSAVVPIANKAMDLLKTNKVADGDIKAENVAFNPKYDYQYSSALIPCVAGYVCPPRPGKEVITGYEAYENISVKIRNVDSVGAIVSGLGAIGVTELSGPNFTVDKQDDLKAEVQKQAIDEAKAKAKVLAKNLGVRLGKITSFNDNGNYPMPMYANAKMDSGGATSSVAPAVVPIGENLITSDVTITYEIR